MRCEFPPMSEKLAMATNLGLTCGLLHFALRAGTLVGFVVIVGANLARNARRTGSFHNVRWGIAKAARCLPYYMKLVGVVEKRRRSRSHVPAACARALRKKPQSYPTIALAYP